MINRKDSFTWMHSAIDVGVFKDGRFDAFVIHRGILGGLLVFESIAISTKIRRRPFNRVAGTFDGRLSSDAHQHAVAPRQLRAVSPTNQQVRESRALLASRLLMTSGGAGRGLRSLDDDPRRGGFLFSTRRLLAGIVLHLEAGDGIVQTTVLGRPGAGLLPAGESTLKSFDRLEGPRPLHLLPLLPSLAPAGRHPVALGRLEDPRQRLNFAPHLG